MRSRTWCSTQFQRHRGGRESVRPAGARGFLPGRSPESARRVVPWSDVASSGMGPSHRGCRREPQSSIALGDKPGVPDGGLAADLARPEPVKRPIGRVVYGLSTSFSPEHVSSTRRTRPSGSASAGGRRRSGGRPGPERQLPGRFVLDVVPLRSDRSPGLEHEGAEPALGQAPSRPSRRSSRSHDDRVEIAYFSRLRHTGAQPSYRPAMGYRSRARIPASEVHQPYTVRYFSIAKPVLIRHRARHGPPAAP